MAEALTRALSLLNIRRENSAVVLKPEQETAINNLLHGRDVMAILPTGFGKSMIYTAFALAKEEISSSKTCGIVIAPLKSIIDDQISEMLSLNCTAMELTTEALNAVRESPPQFLNCSAETVLEKAFLAALKEDSALHRAVSAIVLDKLHTEYQIRNRFPFFSAQIYYYRFRLIMKRAERFNATTRVNNYHFSFGA